MPDPAIAHFRAALHAARCGEPIPPDTAGWLLAGGTRYIAAAEAGNAMGLDVALGLGKPGRHGWRTIEARENRDAFLCELRKRHYPHLSDGEAARQIASQASCIARSRDPRMLAAVCLGLRIPDAKQLRAIFRKYAAV